MHIHPIELPQVLTKVMLVIECQCGCGRKEEIYLTPEMVDVGGVGIWVTEALEVAVGLHWGLFPPSFQQALHADRDNSQPDFFVISGLPIH